MVSNASWVKKKVCTPKHMAETTPGMCERWSENVRYTMVEAWTPETRTRDEKLAIWSVIKRVVKGASKVESLVVCYHHTSDVVTRLVVLDVSRCKG